VPGDRHSYRDSEKRNTMRDLNHQLKQLCRRNRDGSHATQRDRERMLSLIVDQLHALGFRGMNVRPLKPKHVEALIKRRRREEAIEFSPSYANQGDHLRRKESWTKGGKGRRVRPRTPDQR